MLAEDEELVCEGITAYVGTHRTNIHVVNRLLRLCLIRSTGYTHAGEKLQYYEATSECRAILEDPAYEPAIVRAMRTGQPVMINPNASLIGA